MIFGIPRKLVGPMCWRSAWSTESSFNALLASAFNHILAEVQREQSPHYFNAMRDTYRDLLAEKEPAVFPRYGSGVGTDIADVMVKTSRNTLTWRMCCQICGTHQNQHHLLTTAFPSTSTTQSLERSIPSQYQHCNHCQSVTQHSIHLTPPTSFTFTCEGNAQAAVNPSPLIRLPNADSYAPYHLKGVIYFGSTHFSARLVEQSLEGLQPMIAYRYDGTRFHSFSQPEYIQQSEELRRDTYVCGQ
jgi:hypothetical protein